MLPNQRVRHMTGKADRRRGLQSLGEPLRRNLTPFHSLLIGKMQRRLLSDPLNFGEGPPTNRASLPRVPFGEDIADEAILRRGLDLGEALLPAAGAFRPAGAGG